MFRNELASACNVAPNTISNWEGGRTSPPEAAIGVISRTLRFPPDFFFKDGVVSIPAEAATFRARTRLGARDRNSALAAGSMAAELSSWLADRFDLPRVQIPDLSRHAPETAADLLRVEWALGNGPLPNLVHLLESRGALVFSLSQDCHDLDAFTFWSESRPIVLLNMLKSAERGRMDVAHELAHLVLHREGTGKAEEDEADRFAGAFLMQRDDVLRHLQRPAHLPALMTLKGRWGVAVSALAYRLHELKLLSDWNYRSLFIEISKRGFRTSEPNTIARETSSLLPQVFRSLTAQGLTMAGLARELRWGHDQLAELIFGMGGTLVALDGGQR